LDDAGRVRLLFELAYGRPASDIEVSRYLASLQSFENDLKDRRKAWAAVVQVVLAANEFITIK